MSIPDYKDPIELFQLWLREAEESSLKVPTAAALATSNSNGRPSVRMVLLKSVDHRGFVFYTNCESRKGQELGINPFAAMCFYWENPGRQVRVEGQASQVNDEEADAYFATRERASQIGAWASRQSRPLQGRFELEKEVMRHAARFHFGTVPRPQYWSGFRINPDRIEFWLEKPFRLHDRVEYVLENSRWIRQSLFP